MRPRLLATALYLLGYGLWFAAGLILLSVPNVSKVYPNAPWYTAILLALAFVVCLQLGKALLLNAKRLLAAIESNGDSTSAPTVLYLRPFSDDFRARTTSEEGGMPFTSLVTEEEQVAKAVEPIGRLIGIGRPGEPLPELGAKREYLADSDWMPRVVELLEKSQLVLVRVGTSEGIAWEIREAFKRKRPSAIVILLSISQSEYEDLAPELSEITLTRLPNWTQQVNSTFPLKAIIAFNEAGVGTLTPLVPSTNRWEPITPSLRAALEPVCRANGLPWVAPHSRLWYSTRTISYIVAFSVLLVILVRTCGTSVPK